MTSLRHTPTIESGLSPMCKHERILFDNSDPEGVRAHCTCGRIRTGKHRDVRKAKIAFYQQRSDLSRIGPQAHNSTRANLLASKIQESGGFTYNLRTGLFVESGFAVSVYKELEIVIDWTGDKPGKLAQFLIVNHDTLSRKCHYFGAWYDVENRHVYLDVSILVDSEPEARELAAKHNQKAFYCLHEAREVRL